MSVGSRTTGAPEASSGVPFKKIPNVLCPPKNDNTNVIAESEGAAVPVSAG